MSSHKSLGECHVHGCKNELAGRVGFYLYTKVEEIPASTAFFVCAEHLIAAFNPLSETAIRDDLTENFTEAILIANDFISMHRQAGQCSACGNYKQDECYRLTRAKNAVNKWKANT